MKLLAVVFALSFLSASLADNAGSVGFSAPILAWSNRAVIGQGKHVSYQVLPNVERVATDLVLGALGKPEASDFGVHGFPAEGNPEDGRTVVVFIGSELDAAAMRVSSDAVRSLDSLISSAASSLALPYATSQGASIREAVCSKLDNAGVEHAVVGCAAPSADLKADVKAVLAKRGSSQLRAVLVCAQLEAAQTTTNAGLSMEVEQLKAVQEALQDSGVDHVLVYAAQATPMAKEETANSRRRVLQTTMNFDGFGSYTECGALCRTQVRWLEGMLALIFLALASCAGLVCLNVLDTPTRFEAPSKDAAPQQ